MPFKRYSQQDTLFDLSASDFNDRADVLESVAGAIGVMPKPGIVGMIGAVSAIGVPPGAQFVVWGKLTYRSSTSSALASGVTYKAEALDGSIRITTAQTPLFRSFPSTARLIPAAADSLCLIGWYPDPADNLWKERILFVQETFDPGAC